MEENLKTFKPDVVWDPEVEAYLRGALGSERFHRTAAALCRPPRTTCMRVNTLKTSTQAVVDLVRQQLGPDWPQDVVQVHPQVPCAVLLRGSGPHEVSYEAAGCKEVVVSRKAGEAVLRGAPVYAPGVLAVSSGVARGELVALAVARERPGSDTPEITRGTTLYETAPAGEAGSRRCRTDAAPTHLQAAAAVAGAGTPPSPPEPDTSVATPAAGADDADDADAPMASCTGVDIPVTGTTPPEAATTAGASAAAAAAAAQNGTASTAKRRQRQRPQRRGPVRQRGGAPLPGEVTGDPASAADGCSSSPAPPAALPSAADAAAAPPATSSQEPPPPLPPGWTASSQGPVAPRSGMYVGLARAAMSRQEMFRVREGLALQLVEPVFRVPPVTGLPPGWVMLQNLPSLVAALALSPDPGSRVLDMCAAPGGKTTLLAQIMGDEGEIVAFDRTHAKVSEVVSLARELGVTCITAHKMDAGKAVELPPPASDAAVSVPAAGTGAGAATSAAATRRGGEGPVGRANGQGGLGPNDAHPGPQNGPEDGALSSSPCTAVQEGTEAGGGATGGDAAVAVAAPSTAAEAAPAAAEPALSSAPAAAAGVGAGGAPSRPQPSAKALQREERRRAAMIKRGITPPPSPLEAASQRPHPAAYPPESFDAVLLDAPCSALGLRPRLQQQASAAYLRQCAAAQRRLVDAAVQLLRVGGCLVYSTCTINPGENEAIVRYLLDKYGSSFELVPAGPPFLGGPGLVGRHPSMHEAGRPLRAEAAEAALAASEEGGHSTTSTTHEKAGKEEEEEEELGEAWLSAEEASRVQRFDPCDPQLDTIGFFVAKFRKLAAVPLS